MFLLNFCIFSLFLQKSVIYRDLKNYIQQNTKMKYVLKKIFQNLQLQQALRFISLMFLLNYFSQLLEKFNGQIINADFYNQQTQMRSVFSSFNGLMLWQKSGVLIFSLILIKAKSWCKSKYGWGKRYEQRIKIYTEQEELDENDHKQAEQSNKNQHLNNNFSSKQKDHRKQYIHEVQIIGEKQQIILGILSFGAIQIFAYLQQNLNVYHIIQLKCSSTFLIVIISHIFLEYCNKKLIRNKRGIRLWQKIFFILPVVIFSMLIKLNLTGLTGFYFSNLGNSKDNVQTKIIVIAFLLVLIDITYYSMLYLIRKKYILRQNCSYQYGNPFHQAISPQRLLHSISKYTVIFFLLSLLYTQQLPNFIDLMYNYPIIIILLVKLSFFYCLHQYVIYYCLITYDVHIFLAMIGTIGVYEKINDYLFRYWNNNSMLPIGLTVAFVMLIIHVILQKVKQRKQTKEIQQLVTVPKQKPFQI